MQVAVGIKPQERKNDTAMILKTIDISVEGKSATLSGYFLEHIPGVVQGKRPVVIICPGGGYEHLSPREAEPVALQFQARGFHACVLRYSIAPAVYPQALLELAETVRWVRSHAEEFWVDEEKIIVCGFSAGGHLACSLGVFWQEEWLTERLGWDAQLRRPDGMILGYPVITSGEYAHRGSFERLTGGSRELEAELCLENRVTQHMPPTFLWHTCEDTSVPVENSLLLAGALRKAKIPMEMHLFPRGPHGLALADAETAIDGRDGQIQPEVQCWIDLAAAWIRAL